METKTLGFIGGGRITRIILQAFKNEQLHFQSIIVCDINNDVLKNLKHQFPKIQITDSCLLAAKQDIVFLALHPPVIMNTLDQIREAVTSSSIVISLAPKIKLQNLKEKLGIDHLAKMIPNATSYINKGINPIAFSPEFSSLEKEHTIQLINHMGKTLEVDESKLEAYALVSAMLPTYFWFQWEEISKVGQKMGLSELESKAAIHDTLKAAIKLFYKSELTSEEVIDLIPVKPIGEFELQISEMYQSKLMELYQKIKA